MLSLCFYVLVPSVFNHSELTPLRGTHHYYINWQVMTRCSTLDDRTTHSVIRHPDSQGTGTKQEGKAAMIMSVISKAGKSMKSAWGKAYNDTEGTLGVILVGLTLHMVFSVCTGAVLAVISAPWHLTLLLILCECIIAYLTIKPLMDQAKERFYHGSSQH